MSLRGFAGAVVLSFAVASTVLAAPAPGAPQDPAPAQQQQPPPAAEGDEEQAPVYEEQVVVTASKTEETLVNAPASVSVITTETIQNNASSSYADLLRGVPGVNVTQAVETRGADEERRLCTSAVASFGFAVSSDA